MFGSDPALSRAASGGRSIGSFVLRLLAMLAVLAGILLLAAGRLDWGAAWRFVLAYGAFLLFYGLWGMRHDPGQMQERCQGGRNIKAWDKAILTVYTALLLVMLILAGLDAGRFRWSPTPAWAQAVGWLVLPLAGGLIWWASSVNTYLSRWVRIQDDRGQQAVSAGPYRWVRHPMYVGVILFVLSIPLLLGSNWALVPAGLIVMVFVLRTALEDRTLQEELPGYREYAHSVRYRLLPGVW